MKQRFQRDDPDVFDLAWLDDEELAVLQRILADHENEICAYWLRSLNEQAAFAPGNFGSSPVLRPETRTSNSMHSANLMQRG
jgi:hypothetical protein